MKFKEPPSACIKTKSTFTQLHQNKENNNQRGIISPKQLLLILFVAFGLLIASFKLSFSIEKLQFNVDTNLNIQNPSSTSIRTQSPKPSTRPPVHQNKRVKPKSAVPSTDIQQNQFIVISSSKVEEATPTLDQ